MKAARKAATTIGTIRRRNEPATASAIVSAAIAAITRAKRVAPAQDRSKDAVMAAAPPIPAARGAKAASAMSRQHDGDDHPPAVVVHAREPSVQRSEIRACVPIGLEPDRRRTSLLQRDGRRREVGDARRGRGSAWSRT